jgi:DNA-binding Lrp family transcriptional regulator
MISAYILIQAGGAASRVSREVAGIQGVNLVEDVSGPYDVIARADARNLSDLTANVLTKIQAIDYVDRTLTCRVVPL